MRKIAWYGVFWMMAWVLCVSSLHAGVVDPGVGKAGSSSRSETGTGSGVSVVDVGSGPTMSDTEDLDPPADLLGPRDVSEESLPDFAGAGVGFYPPLELAKRVAEHGATHLNPHSTPHLTLFLADWALNAGAALRNPEWLRIKAGALMVLERYSEALGVMENLPPFLFREDPLLTLQLARVHLANGGYKPARELYSRFLVEQSQNFQVKEAEKGMVLTVLAAGELDQAELLLGLMTEAGDKRLRNDPDLAAAMGRLMHLKGRKAESGRWLKILASMAEPSAWDRRRQWLRDVAELTVAQGDWSKGMAVLEELLAQYPGPTTLALYTRLMESAPANGLCASKGNVQGERLGWVRLLRDSRADSLEREVALEVLLEEERQRPLGLTGSEGILAPEKVLPDLTSPEAAVLYAAHAWRKHQFSEAWALLQDVPGVLAAAWRLAIVAADFSPAEEVDAKAWIADLPDPARDAEALTIAEPLAAAMLGFTEKMDLSEAGRIRRFLTRLPGGTRIRESMEDILGLQAAMARELNEQPQVALTLYLELVLAGEKGGSERQWPWYVSETPAQAVLRLLEDTGRVREAAEFKKIWLPGSKN